MTFTTNSLLPWFALLLPLGSAGVITLVTRRWKNISGAISIAAVLGSFACSCAIFAKVDISALLGGDIYSLLRTRSEKARSRFSKERDEDKALKERQKCLAKLAQAGDIPPEVLMSLPSPEEIARRAEEASARAKAALVGQASRLPTGRLALEDINAGGTPGAAGGTPAPLPD